MEQLQENLEEYDKLQSLTSERDHILFVACCHNLFLHHYPVSDDVLLQVMDSSRDHCWTELYHSAQLGSVYLYHSVHTTHMPHNITLTYVLLILSWIHKNKFFHVSQSSLARMVYFDNKNWSTHPVTQATEYANQCHNTHTSKKSTQFLSHTYNVQHDCMLCSIMERRTIRMYYCWRHLFRS